MKGWTFDWERFFFLLCLIWVAIMMVLFVVAFAMQILVCT